MSLSLCHVELKQANNFVTLYHRHHKPVAGHRFSLGCTRNGELSGVCIVGRPVARATDWKRVVEVTRLCVKDNERNVCSFLYAAAARAAFALGFEKIQTFILDSEPGVTLMAAGWVFESMSAGGNWNSASHVGRRTDQPMGQKQKWSKSK